MPITGANNWDVERHKRGEQRYYPFDVLPNTGLGSSGSTSVVACPNLSINTGVSTATPQNRGRDLVERKGGAASTVDSWAGSDNLNYWGRKQRMYSWMGIGGSTITPVGGRLYCGIFLQSPFSTGGIGPFPLNPMNPLVMLRYVRNGTLDVSIDERFELCTAVGDGSATVITRLTGVPGPRSDYTGTPWAQRLELLYKPNVGVYAYVDGILGAINTTGLPDVTRIPVAAAFMAGWGVYLEASNLGDSGQASFYSSMIETYRP